MLNTAASRPKLPASLERDLRLEVGGVCPFTYCRMPAQENCHIWDRAKGGPDVFGNILRACAAHHHQHTAGQIPDHDLRVLKARLAWNNDRYTHAEYMWLQVFAKLGGTHFKYQSSGRNCLRFLQADGYVELLETPKQTSSTPQTDAWRFTKIGQLFAKAWQESGAYPIDIERR